MVISLPMNYSYHKIKVAQPQAVLPNRRDPPIGKLHITKVNISPVNLHSKYVDHDGDHHGSLSCNRLS